MESSVNLMDKVTSGVTALMNLSSTMLDTILSNPVYAALFAAGFIGIAINIVRQLKNA